MEKNKWIQRDEPFVMETRKGLALCARRMNHKPSLLSFSVYKTFHENEKKYIKNMKWNSKFLLFSFIHIHVNVIH